MVESKAKDPTRIESASPAAAGVSRQAEVNVDPEMAGMMRSRRLEARRRQAQLAQIRRHPDPSEPASGMAQQRIWALRHARQRRLKLSDLAMLRQSS